MMTEEVIRLKCPACGTYIGSTDGGYFEARPCDCGAQTVVRISRERLLKILSKSSKLQATT